MTASPGIRVHGQHQIDDRVLFHTTLAIAGGQWTCLLGRSGVGKSTILRLILGLETGGAFNGHITATDNAPLVDRIGYMAQSDLLLPWASVLDNVVIGAKLRGDAPDMDAARALVDRVGLAAHVDRKPATLSGGMRQRVALARTLFEDRPIVLLDEPFSALDAGTRADMQDLAAELLQDRTVLLVTHDPAEAARLGHQIIVMTADGMQDWPLPDTAPPRDITAPATLTAQADLLSFLRAGTS